MKKLILVISAFCMFVSGRAYAYVSLPENCLSREVAPCLVRVEQDLSFPLGTSFLQVKLRSGSLLKLKKFGTEPEFDLISGKMIIELKADKRPTFFINGTAFRSQQIFVSSNADDRVFQVYDRKNFLLSDFELNPKAPRKSGNQQNNDPDESSVELPFEAVLLKSKFLEKREMVKYLAYFFSTATELKKWLNENEVAWRREFGVQTEQQTKVLGRALASEEIQNAEKEERKKRQDKELKKVRELFFYRTFYR